MTVKLKYGDIITGVMAVIPFVDSFDTQFCCLLSKNEMGWVKYTVHQNEILFVSEDECLGEIKQYFEGSGG